MSDDKKEYTKELLGDLSHYRFGPIWDGNVNSKSMRDSLVDRGLVARSQGFQFLTERGVTVLHHMGLLNQDTWRERRAISCQETDGRPN